jgi:uncharacterized protein
MRLIVLFFCLVIGLPAAAQQLSLPDYASITVNDYADLLDDSAEADISAQLDKLRKDTGIEMTVLTLESQSLYWKDMELEPFATSLFNSWGIGDKTRNDGILVLVLRTDRAMRIELGMGYGTEWDRTAADIIDRSFLPSFADGDYQGGIKTGVTDVIDSLAMPFWREEDPPGDFPDFLMFILVAGAMFSTVFWRPLADRLYRLRRCPQCGKRGLHRHRHTITAATRKSTGEGEIIVECPSCHYNRHTPYTISRITRSSSSSGSFGGGSSSGGGASGRW